MALLDLGMPVANALDQIARNVCTAEVPASYWPEFVGPCALRRHDASTAHAHLCAAGKRWVRWQGHGNTVQRLWVQVA